MNFFYKYIIEGPIYINVFKMHFSIYNFIYFAFFILLNDNFYDIFILIGKKSEIESFFHS